MATTLINPKTKERWEVDTDDPEAALRAFNNVRAKNGIAPDAQIEVLPPNPQQSPDASGQIKTDDQGNFVLPEPDMPELNTPAEPMGTEATDDFFRMGADAEGNKLMEGMSPFQRAMQQGGDLVASAADMSTLGLVSAAENRIRQGLDNSTPPEWAQQFLPKDINQKIKKALFFDKPMDQILEEGSHRAGPIPRLAAGTAGGWAGLSRLLPEAWMLPKSGIKGGAARTAVAPVDEMAVQQADAALRGEDASFTEGTGTAAAMQLVGELAGVGINKGGTGFRQRNMTPTEIGAENVSPAVRAWLKNSGVYGPSQIPDADIRTQLGESIIPAIRAGADQAPGGFKKLKEDAQQRRQGTMERVQKTAEDVTGIRPLDTAEGQAQAFKDQAHDPSTSREYTQALKAPFQNVFGKVKRRVKEPGSGKMVDKMETVGVPQAFKDTLTSSSTLYDMYKSAESGANGGIARAETKALQRKSKATKAEQALHTIFTLRDGGQAEQDLSKKLMDQMGDFNVDLGALTKKQAELWQQHRGALQGAKVFTNPANLDKLPIEIRRDPTAMRAVADAFVAKFVEATSKDKMPPLTDQMRKTANELLGERRAGALFNRFSTEQRIIDIDDPIVGTTPGVSMDVLNPKSQSFGKKLGKFAGRTMAGLGGGYMGIISALGPAAGQFLKDNPKALSPDDWEGLFSLLRQYSVPDTKTNLAERTKVRIGTAAAQSNVTDNRRKDRARFHKGED